MATTIMLAVVRDGREILSAHHFAAVAWLEAAKLEGKHPDEIAQDKRYKIVDATIKTK